MLRTALERTIRQAMFGPVRVVCAGVAYCRRKILLTLVVGIGLAAGSVTAQTGGQVCPDCGEVHGGSSTTRQAPKQPRRTLSPEQQASWEAFTRNLRESEERARQDRLRREQEWRESEERARQFREAERRHQHDEAQRRVNEILDGIIGDLQQASPPPDLRSGRAGGPTLGRASHRSPEAASGASGALDLPALDRSLAGKPSLAAKPGGPDEFKLDSPAKQLTFDGEGREGGRFHSRTPTVPKGRGGKPDSRSGLTLGRGYDMGQKSRAKIIEDLTAAGVPLAVAEKYAGAANLHGEKAEKFRADNEADLTEITPAQQKKLFEIAYGEAEEDVKRICGNKSTTDTYGAVDWDKLDPAIRAVLIDLRFKGDYRPETRRVIQQYASANEGKGDLEGFTKAMSDEKFWRGPSASDTTEASHSGQAAGAAASVGPTKTTPPYGRVARERFDQRIEFLKQALSEQTDTL